MLRRCKAMYLLDCGRCFNRLHNILIKRYLQWVRCMRVGEAQTASDFKIKNAIPIPENR